MQIMQSPPGNARPPCNHLVLVKSWPREIHQGMPQGTQNQLPGRVRFSTVTVQQCPTCDSKLIVDIWGSFSVYSCQTERRDREPWIFATSSSEDFRLWLDPPWALLYRSRGARPNGKFHSETCRRWTNCRNGLNGCHVSGSHGLTCT